MVDRRSIIVRMRIYRWNGSSDDTDITEYTNSIYSALYSGAADQVQALYGHDTTNSSPAYDDVDGNATRLWWLWASNQDIYP